MNTLEFGTIPKAVHVVLTVQSMRCPPTHPPLTGCPVLAQHELVDTCKAGDDAVVTAVVRQRWQPARPDERCGGLRD